MSAAIAAFPLEKLPPANVDAEQSVLGALLIDPTAIFAVRELLTPDDFFRDSHRFLYAAMLKLAEAGTPADIVTVSDELERTEQLAEAGGVAYIHSLATVVPTAIHVEHYAKVVKRTAIKRQLIGFGGRIAKIGYDDSLSVDEALESVAALLSDISASRTERHAGIFELTELSDDLHRLYEEGWTAGVSTGWPELDEYYRPVLGDWTLVIGIPSHGKSSVVDALAYNLMRQYDWRWGICSPENQPLIRHEKKFLQLHTGKPFDRGPEARMSVEEMVEAEAWLHERLKFVLPAEGQRSVQGVLAVLGAAVEQHKLQAVVIDPWNELEHNQEKHLREDQYIARALSDLRNFARHRNVHLFLVAHPHQLLKDRDTGKYPVVQPYDIHGGSMFYNKGDNILSVYRDGTTQIHVQKVRFEGMNGRKTESAVELVYDRLTGRFSTPGSRQQDRERAPHWARE